MRSIVVTQSAVQLDGMAEAYLFSALAGLENQCDSLRSCRVHLQGAEGSPKRRKPFSVTLLLCVGEHFINVRASEWTNNALTARDAIGTAIREAEHELRNLRITNQCSTCCDLGYSLQAAVT